MEVPITTETPRCHEVEVNLLTINVSTGIPYNVRRVYLGVRELTDVTLLAMHMRRDT
jgi:hypothetical protein